MKSVVYSRQMNKVNLVDAVILMPCMEVTVVHMVDGECSWVTLHILVSYPASLAAVGVSRWSRSALVLVGQRKTVPSRSSFAAVTITLIRRAVFAADGGTHTATGDM